MKYSDLDERKLMDIYSESNYDNTEYKEFRSGAEKCHQKAITEKVDLVILQSRSPSCGVKQVYDGSFSGKLIEGKGIFAELLAENGIKTIDLSELLEG